VPVKRRAAKARIEGVSPLAYALLTDQPLEAAEAAGWEVFILNHSLRSGEMVGPGGRPSLWAMWIDHRDDILAEWAEEHPGTRPSCWWRWDAPRAAVGACWGRYDVTDADRYAEPRRRLGGIGTPNHEALHYVATFEYGLPDSWVTPSDVRFYNGRSRDVHGNPVGTEWKEGHFPHHAPDPSDPPAYESQAAYLKRHGLLFDGEAERLTAEDFEPELIDAAGIIEARRAFNRKWYADAAARGCPMLGNPEAEE
jgi:hypothetical protein